MRATGWTGPRTGRGSALAAGTQRNIVPRLDGVIRTARCDVRFSRRLASLHLGVPNGRYNHIADPSKYEFEGPTFMCTEATNKSEASQGRNHTAMNARAKAGIKKPAPRSMSSRGRPSTTS